MPGFTQPSSSSNDTFFPTDSSEKKLNFDQIVRFFVKPFFPEKEDAFILLLNNNLVLNLHEYLFEERDIEFLYDEILKFNHKFSYNKFTGIIFDVGGDLKDPVFAAILEQFDKLYKSNDAFILYFLDCSDERKSLVEKLHNTYSPLNFEFYEKKMFQTFITNLKKSLDNHHPAPPPVDEDYIEDYERTILINQIASALIGKDREKILSAIANGYAAKHLDIDVSTFLYDYCKKTNFDRLFHLKSLNENPRTLITALNQIFQSVSTAVIEIFCNNFFMAKHIDDGNGDFITEYYLHDNIANEMNAKKNACKKKYEAFLRVIDSDDQPFQESSTISLPATSEEKVLDLDPDLEHYFSLLCFHLKDGYYENNPFLIVNNYRLHINLSGFNFTTDYIKTLLDSLEAYQRVAAEPIVSVSIDVSENAMTNQAFAMMVATLRNEKNYPPFNFMNVSPERSELLKRKKAIDRPSKPVLKKSPLLNIKEHDLNDHFDALVDETIQELNIDTEQVLINKIAQAMLGPDQEKIIAAIEHAIAFKTLGSDINTILTSYLSGEFNRLQQQQNNSLKHDELVEDLQNFVFFDVPDLVLSEFFNQFFHEEIQPGKDGKIVTTYRLNPFILQQLANLENSLNTIMTAHEKLNEPTLSLEEIESMLDDASINYNKGSFVFPESQEVSNNFDTLPASGLSSYNFFAPPNISPIDQYDHDYKALLTLLSSPFTNTISSTISRHIFIVKSSHAEGFSVILDKIESKSVSFNEFLQCLLDYNHAVSKKEERIQTIQIDGKSINESQSAHINFMALEKLLQSGVKLVVWDLDASIQAQIQLHVSHHLHDKIEFQLSVPLASQYQSY